MADRKLYETTAEITIPAGTRLLEAPTRTTRLGPCHVEAVIGHGPDNHSVWNIDIEGGLEAGAIREIEPQPGTARALTAREVLVKAAELVNHHATRLGLDPHATIELIKQMDKLPTESSE